MINGRSHAPRVAVVGGINLDIHMKSQRGKIRQGDKNPCSVWSGAGGVGRNIASMVAACGVSVTLFGAVGDDLLSHSVVAETRAAGVNVDPVIQVEGQGVGTYVAFLDEDGELATGGSAMEVTDEVTPEYIRSVRGELETADLIVADTNIPPSALQQLVDLADSASIPLLIEPVSVTKAERINQLRGRVWATTPNLEESRILGAADGPAVENTIVTQGSGPVLHLSGDTPTGNKLSAGGRGEFPVSAVEPMDVTGAGDAFVAGMVTAVASGIDLKVAIPIGIQAAGRTVVQDGIGDLSAFGKTVTESINKADGASDGTELSTS